VAEPVCERVCTGEREALLGAEREMAGATDDVVLGDAPTVSADVGVPVCDGGSCDGAAPVGVTVGVELGVSAAVVLDVLVGVGVDVAVTLGVGVELPDTESDPFALGGAPDVGVTLADVLFVLEGEGVGVGVGEAEPVPLAVGVGVGLGLTLGDPVADAAPLLEGVPDEDAPGETDAVGVDDSDALSVAVELGVPEGELVGVGVALPVGVPLRVAGALRVDEDVAPVRREDGRGRGWQRREADEDAAGVADGSSARAQANEGNSNSGREVARTPRSAGQIHQM
jgi:hypothetical protein